MSWVERKKPELISVKEVETATELAQAQRIRVQVLEEEQGFAHDVNLDGCDETADHVLVLDDGEPVATARLTEAGDGGLERSCRPEASSMRPKPRSWVT